MNQTLSICCFVSLGEREKTAEEIYNADFIPFRRVFLQKEKPTRFFAPFPITFFFSSAWESETKTVANTDNISENFF